MLTPLQKSVRVYRLMIAKIPLHGHATKTPEFRESLAYLRELYREYGRDAVRRELSKATS